MKNCNKFYINGAWIKPNGEEKISVINPSNEEVICDIPLANSEELDLAVKSAKSAFVDFSNYKLEEKISIFENIINSFKKRINDLAQVISLEMGAPITLSEKAQAPSGLGHFINTLQALKDFEFEKIIDNSLVRKEPIGVCGLITPWNWPINQIACKVAPALAAGCTIILKPSELAPLSSIIFTEILDDAGLPHGVFNLIHGNGEIGKEISKHPYIDMVSFTGSTKAGISVAKNAADTVKRVTQELGGKSANIILDDGDFEKSIKKGILSCMSNSGQSCNAPTRMLIPMERMNETVKLAKEIVETIVVGNPKDPETTLGPLVSKPQYDKVKNYIEKGIEEGAELIVGGTDFPVNINKGYFIKPTIFANVKNNMIIAKEEIFGPVLSIIGYKDEKDAIDIANDSEYGLSGYISSNNKEKAISIAKKIRSGMVHINYTPVNQKTPFGGYKKSGNGREWGKFGIEDFLEYKSIIGTS